ncbi:MAG: ArsR family transcriptional regulator [Thermoplasmatota archaeon]
MIQLPKKQRKIIELLTSDKKTLTELTNSLGISKSGTLKHLKQLTNSEIISKKLITTEDGRESVYSLNRYTYFFSINPDTESIIEFNTHQKFILEHLLLEQVPQKQFKSELKTLFENLKKPPFTILYGSTAEGKATWKSDIDILFLKEKWDDRESIINIISDVNMEIEHQIKPEFKNFDQFKKQTTLMEEIKDSGIVIYGELDEHPEIWKKMKRYRNFID